MSYFASMITSFKKCTEKWGFSDGEKKDNFEKCVNIWVKDPGPLEEWESQGTQ